MTFRIILMFMSKHFFNEILNNQIFLTQIDLLLYLFFLLIILIIHCLNVLVTLVISPKNSISKLSTQLTVTFELVTAQSIH